MEETLDLDVGYQQQGQSPSMQGPAEESLNQCIAGVIRALALEDRGGFEISDSNQKEIRVLCEVLGQKFDDLAERTAALVEEVSVLRRAMEEQREAIQDLETGKERVQLSLESMGNNLRRNNLRFLTVPVL
ncbi:hypothetical protein NDU88_003601 [Pleurodeles waltl]|uniref:Uncharacterized protein n=1 Tax=Pleurodeles waltl TaxID=8319 RepID=A0AAV7KW28_PLEWA|nr:hypothetical protein NDU88_003601 [Pleurodeles waltl]